MPKLRNLMADTEAVWEEDVTADKLDDILGGWQRRPSVVIRVSVTNELTGEVVEDVRYESPEMWERGYRQYYKGEIIRRAADNVAARIAYADDEKRDRGDG